MNCFWLKKKQTPSFCYYFIANVLYESKEETREAEPANICNPNVFEAMYTR